MLIYLLLSHSYFANMYIEQAQREFEIGLERVQKPLLYGLCPWISIPLRILSRSTIYE